MNSTKIVNLGMVRDMREMLVEWEKVRQAILAGQIEGFHTALRDRNQRETIYVGGIYKEDPAAAVRASLKVSMTRMLGEDAPLRGCGPQLVRIAGT